MAKFQILGAYPDNEKHGGSTRIGRCDFTFVPDLGPLKLQQQYPEKDDAGKPIKGKWKTFDCAEINAGEGTTITVRSAKVGVKNGKPWLMHDTVQIPFDLSEMVAAEAVERIKARLPQQQAAGRRG